MIQSGCSTRPSIIVLRLLSRVLHSIGDLERVRLRMFNGKERPLALADFLVEAQVLLTTAEECLSHLGLIRDDEDAINCMLFTLLKLEQRAHALRVAQVADFCGTLSQMLNRAKACEGLNHQTVETLKDCFILLAWQLELIDLNTGSLALDDTEQKRLIATLSNHIESAPATASTENPKQ